MKPYLLWSKSKLSRIFVPLWDCASCRFFFPVELAVCFSSIRDFRVGTRTWSYFPLLGFTMLTCLFFMSSLIFFFNMGTLGRIFLVNFFGGFERVVRRRRVRPNVKRARKYDFWGNYLQPSVVKTGQAWNLFGGLNWVADCDWVVRWVVKEGVLTKANTWFTRKTWGNSEMTFMPYKLVAAIFRFLPNLIHYRLFVWIRWRTDLFTFQF